MKIFAGPRGSGRTIALINWVREDPDPDNRRLVVLNKQQARSVLDMAPDIRIWTLEHVNTRGWKSYVSLAVDDYDQMISQELYVANHFGRQIRAISLESEDFINIPVPPHMIKMDHVIQGMVEIAGELRA